MGVISVQPHKQVTRDRRPGEALELLGCPAVAPWTLGIPGDFSRQLKRTFSPCNSLFLLPSEASPIEHARSIYPGPLPRPPIANDGFGHPVCLRPHGLVLTSEHGLGSVWWLS